MRIMLDTNVLISALLFPGTKMNAMMDFIFTNNQLVLSSDIDIERLEIMTPTQFMETYL